MRVEQVVQNQRRAFGEAQAKQYTAVSLKRQFITIGIDFFSYTQAGYSIGNFLKTARSLEEGIYLR